MLARVKDRQHVHFGAQFDEHSGFRVAGHKLHVAAGINNDLAEEINWGGQISCREPVLRELDDKTVVCILVTIVTELLVARFAILAGNISGIRATAERIVPANGVGGDRAQHAAHVRVQDVASGEMPDVLCLEGVRHVVAFRGILPVIEDRTHVGAALNVADLQRSAAFQNVRPRRAGLKHFLKQSLFSLLSDVIPRRE